MTSKNAMQKFADEPLKQSTCQGSINAGSVTENSPFCNTPEITENSDVLEVKDESIMEEHEDRKSVTSLQNEIYQLKIQLAEAESKLNRSLLRLENIRHDKRLLKFYTGFSNYETLSAFYEEILELDVLLMRQWSGKRSKHD